MTGPILPASVNESNTPHFYLVVNDERLLGLYRDGKAAQRLAEKLAPARVVAIPRDAEREQIAAAIGVEPMHRIVRHSLGKLAMVVFHDPRAFGMTDWACAQLHARQPARIFHPAQSR